MPARKSAYDRKIAQQIRAVNRLDREITRRIQKAAKEARAKIHDKLRELASARAKRLTPNQVSYLRTEAARELGAFRAKAMNILSQGIEQSQELGALAGEAALEQIGISGAVIPAASPQITALAMEYGADLITKITEETRRAINAELMRAILGELTPYDAMRTVDKAMGVGLKHGITMKAERIVRTELTRAYSMAQAASLNSIAGQLPDETRPKLMKTWISAKHPGRTRPAHWEADGQTVPYDKPFIVGGEELDFPGDPKGSAANTINCLCRMVINTEKLVG